MKKKANIQEMQLYKLSEEIIDLAQNHDPFFNYLTRAIVLPNLKKKKARLIDLGCGGGRNLIAAAKKGYQVIGIDINRKALHIASKRLSEEGLASKNNLYSADITKMNGRKWGNFDYCILQEVIEHINNYQKAIDVAYRELKKGGVMILTTPNNPAQWNILDDYAGHLRRFTNLEIREALTRFTAVKVFTVGFPFHRLSIYFYNIYLNSIKGDHDAAVFRANSLFAKIYFYLGSILLNFDHFWNFTSRGTTIVAVAVK